MVSKVTTKKLSTTHTKKITFYADISDPNGSESQAQTRRMK